MDDENPHNVTEAEVGLGNSDSSDNGYNNQKNRDKEFLSVQILIGISVVCALISCVLCVIVIVARYF